MDYVHLTQEKLDLEAINKLVTSPSCGAISIFIGTTRDNFKGRKVLRLEYEAYNEMAVKEMKKICSLIREKWSVENIAIHHRLGLVPITESSVIIAIASPHRQASMEASQFAINTLKATVPIWKKEVYEDGATEWKENCECAWTKNDG